MEQTQPNLRPQGADLLPAGGVHYRIWAPQAQAVEVVIFEPEGNSIVRALAMTARADGFYVVVDKQGAAGDRYQYRVNGNLFPDPFSRWQPNDPADPSMVIDPHAYRWKVDHWLRLPLEEAILYELHIGAFTPEGTFRSAINRLDYLVELGVTTLEIMPVAAYPGQRNWGYDGVMLFAPDSSYGHPDDFRALVDAAHQRGLNVILDVVYNHFGPEGNYLGCFSPHYFNPQLKTPWGDAINFSGPQSRHVRAIFLANVAYWLDEFRLDGFRLDATHEILDSSTPHILAEIARTARQRGAIVTAEDDRNLASLALPAEQGGTGLDGLWADDFHHTVRVALTGKREGYFASFEGTPDELAQTAAHGWFYRGQPTPFMPRPRGTPTGNVRPAQLIHCISNHDQTGNQAFGERLNHLVSPEAYRAASALLCLTPGTPLLFMGQEWAASSPFLYFTDHHDELGRMVTEGRRREFKEFVAALDQTQGPPVIPDPQAEATFLQSKLRWDELSLPAHQQSLLLYRELLHLRRTEVDIRKRTRQNCRAELLGDGVVGILFQESIHSGLLTLLDLSGGHQWEPAADPFAPLPPGWQWQVVFSSNDSRFGGPGSTTGQSAPTRFSFDQPELLLLKPVRAS